MRGSNHVQDPNRTILGSTQKEYLKQQLSAAEGKQTWKVLGQQVLFAHRCDSPSADQWDGESSQLMSTHDSCSCLIVRPAADRRRPTSETMRLALTGPMAASVISPLEPLLACHRPNDTVQQGVITRHHPFFRRLTRALLRLQRGYGCSCREHLQFFEKSGGSSWTAGCIVSCLPFSRHVRP